MASCKVFLCLSLHVLFLVSSSGTRLFPPFSTTDPSLKTESKSQLTASTNDEMAIVYRHFESKQFSGMDLIPLTVAAGEEHPKSSLVESKRALIEEARDAIQASIQRNGGVPFEPERLSPGGPDPHHH